MAELDPKAKTVLFSAFSGAFILGLFSRLAMATIAILSNTPMNLSLRSITEMIFIGAIIGAIGGIVLLGTKKFIQPGIFRGTILGLLLYTGSLVIGLMCRCLASSENPIALITLIVIGVIYVLYGIFTEWMLERNKC